MTKSQGLGPNVKQVVPFLHASSLSEVVRFYVDGLGFQMVHQWTPGGELRWCWLTLGGASIMIQPRGTEPADHRAISLCFMCDDALAIYEMAKANGLQPDEPYVGNSLWVTSLVDPDGNRVEFESPTEVPEGTKLSDLAVA